MRFRTLALAVASPLLAGTADAQTPQDTGFTYQGRLADGGMPADGAFDFQFLVYDAAVGGSQVGPIVLHDDVVVAGGLFTVRLDFGASFGGNKRWLDISVRRGASTGVYTPIVPRQEVSAAPSALFSAATTWPGVAGKPAGFADDTDDDVLGGLACASGQVAKWNGSAWTCAADSVNAGTVTSVATGAGLAGGPITSSGTLSVAFGGSGAAASVSRSDHDHGGQVWTVSTASGLTVENAMAGANALAGRVTASTGIGYGVIGETSSVAGAGVFGRSAPTSGSGVGVYGQVDSSSGWGVAGFGGRYGVEGRVSSTHGAGVFGWHIATAGQTSGVEGWAQSPIGNGVVGQALATSGDARGVFGQSASLSGTGVYGLAYATQGVTYGVLGRSSSNDGVGVRGYTTSTSGPTTGVVGESFSSDGRGVWGQADGTGASIAVLGTTSATSGVAVWGNSSAQSGLTIGVRGYSSSTGGYGVYGSAIATTGTPIGVFGQVFGTTGYAGYFQGRAHVTGTLSKGAGAFKIDHPLDPENKYLYHSFVESPDMKNVYDGVVTTDAGGLARVELPKWFEALNRDFRYQLTVIGDGAWARARVFRKIADNAFVLQTDRPGVEVSWQVTGIRKDAYAERYRIPVEEDKPDDERGTYLHPDAWGVPLERGIDARRSAPDTLSRHP